MIGLGPREQEEQLSYDELMQAVDAVDRAKEANSKAK